MSDLNQKWRAAIPWRLAAGAWWIVFAIPGLLLLMVTDTWRGKILAAAVVVAATLPYLVLLTFVRRARTSLAMWMAGVFCGGSALWLVCTAPASGQLSSKHVFVHYSQGAIAPRLLGLCRLLPEQDQLSMGFSIAPLVDRNFTTAQAGELKSLTRAIYREIDADSDFSKLESLLPYAYADAVASAPRDFPVFVYVPERSAPAAGFPVVVFFHGAGGAFKAYMWILAKVADRLGAVLVMPSAGVGQWDADTAERALEEALVSAQHMRKIDRDRVHLVGLSNGGLALTRLNSTQLARARTLVFISPVFDESVLSRRASLEGFETRRVLIVAGGRDDRVPPDYVAANASRLKTASSVLQHVEWTEANHFLMFSHRKKLQDLLATWISNDHAQPNQ